MTTSGGRGPKVADEEGQRQKTIVMSCGLARELEALARAQDRTASAEIRRAIAEHVERHQQATPKRTRARARSGAA